MRTYHLHRGWALTCNKQQHFSTQRKTYTTRKIPYQFLQESSRCRTVFKLISLLLNSYSFEVIGYLPEEDLKGKEIPSEVKYLLRNYETMSARDRPLAMIYIYILHVASTQKLDYEGSLITCNHEDRTLHYYNVIHRSVILAKPSNQSQMQLTIAEVLLFRWMKGTPKPIRQTLRKHFCRKGMLRSRRKGELELPELSYLSLASLGQGKGTRGDSCAKINYAGIFIRS